MALQSTPATSEPASMIVTIPLQAEVHPTPRQDLELIQDTTVAAHMAPLARQWASGSATTGGEEIEVNPEREDVVEEEDAEEEAEPEGQQTSSMLEQQFRNIPTAEELFGSDVPSESSQVEGEVTQGSQPADTEGSGFGSPRQGRTRKR